MVRTTPPATSVIGRFQLEFCQCGCSGKEAEGGGWDVLPNVSMMLCELVLLRL